MDVDNKKNLTQDVKQKLDDYRKKCYKIWKNKNWVTNKDWLMVYDTKNGKSKFRTHFNFFV